MRRDFISHDIAQKVMRVERPCVEDGAPRVHRHRNQRMFGCARVVVKGSGGIGQLQPQDISCYVKFPQRSGDIPYRSSSRLKVLLFIMDNCVEYVVERDRMDIIKVGQVVQT